jgi:hypothetical protein
MHGETVKNGLIWLITVQWRGFGLHPKNHKPKIHTNLISLEIKSYLFGTPLYVVLIMT